MVSASCSRSLIFVLRSKTFSKFDINSTRAFVALSRLALCISSLSIISLSLARTHERKPAFMQEDVNYVNILHTTIYYMIYIDCSRLRQTVRIIDLWGNPPKGIGRDVVAVFSRLLFLYML